MAQGLRLRRESCAVYISPCMLMPIPVKQLRPSGARVGSVRVLLSIYIIDTASPGHIAHALLAPRRLAINSGALGALVTTVAAPVTAAAPMQKAAQRMLECHRAWCHGDGLCLLLFLW